MENTSFFRHLAYGLRLFVEDFITNSIFAIFIGIFIVIPVLTWLTAVPTTELLPIWARWIAFFISFFAVYTKKVFESINLDKQLTKNSDEK